MKTREEIEGYEYDWLACDNSGHIALLSTAGGGYPPRALLADTDGYYRAIDAILKLPVTTSAKVAPPVAEGLSNDWEQAVERGLYAFDSDTFGAPYRRVGIPRTPALIEDFPAAIAAVVERVRFTAIQFALVERVTQEDIIKSENNG